MASEQEIEAALDAQLMAAFPADDQGHPQTELTRRAAGIADTVAGLLQMDGYPKIEGYNYHQTSSDIVSYNMRQYDDTGFWVSAHTIKFDASDTALTEQVFNMWKSEFEGTRILTKAED